MVYGFERLAIGLDCRVARLNINNPPANMINKELLSKLNEPSSQQKADTGLTNMVKRSISPDFILTHFNKSAI